MKYIYRGIPKDQAVLQVKGECIFHYLPDEGEYTSSHEHPELAHYLVTEEEAAAMPKKKPVVGPIVHTRVKPAPTPEPKPKKAKVEDILDEAPKAKKQKKNR